MAHDDEGEPQKRQNMAGSRLGAAAAARSSTWQRGVAGRPHVTADLIRRVPV